MRHPNGGDPGSRRLLQTFGRDLREARRRAGLSQRAVAQRLGVSQSYVSLVERGLRDPPLSSMGAFAEALGYELTVAFRPVPPASTR